MSNDDTELDTFLLEVQVPRRPGTSQRTKIAMALHAQLPDGNDVRVIDASEDSIMALYAQPRVALAPHPSMCTHDNPPTIDDELKEALFDLLEEHFPKDQCKERGAAMVLIAEALMAVAKRYKTQPAIDKTKIRPFDKEAFIKSVNELKEIMEPPAVDDGELSEDYDSLETNPLLNTGFAREIEELLRGHEPVLDGEGKPKGFDLVKDERTEYGFYWEFEDIAEAAKEIAQLIHSHNKARTAPVDGELPKKIWHILGGKPKPEGFWQELLYGMGREWLEDAERGKQLNELLALIHSRAAQRDKRLAAQMQAEIVDPAIDPELGTYDYKQVAENALDFIEAQLQGHQ